MGKIKDSQALQEWNTTQKGAFRELCIHQMFEFQVERSPDAVAVVFENEQLTYRQLNQRTNQIAHHLRTLGVGPEVLVGICMERSLEMVLGLLGILKAGGAYVPLDPAYPLERLAFILQDTQTTVMLTQEKLVKSLPQLQAQVVCLDSDWGIIAQKPIESPVCETTIDNLIYVIYTSGSTGQPKGVMICHRGICNQLYWRQAAFGLTQTDRVLQTISFSFDPSVWQIFWPLCFGAQLIVPRPGGHQDSAYLVGTIVKQQISVLAIVPSMLRVFLQEKEIENCKCLRHISCSGEALPVELIERFFSRLDLDNVLHNVYGPTEASIDATYWTCQRGRSSSIAPIGRPITNTQIYILNSDLQPVAVGEAGELYISGTGLARGYLNRPDLIAAKFIPNPLGSFAGDRLYKTGDLARYMSDGNIEFLGRIDSQVKIRGFRIELEEIEAVLEQHPSVQTTVVVAREDTIDNKCLVAYVIPNQEQEVTVSELSSFLKQKLASYMVPSAFVMLEALPLTPNGKVDRRALPALERARKASEFTFVAPRDTIERQLTQIWEEILGIQPIGITDNFFDLGGHSLLAIRLLTQIELRFGKTLPLSTFLQAPTVEQLANILHQEESPALWEALVPIQTRGEKFPLFCVHGADGNVIVFHNLSRHLGFDQPLYALQPHGLDGKQTFHTRIEDEASDYIKYMRSVQPEGPYLLAGFSTGGVVAFEMAQQLQAQGQKVALLALFDTISPGSPMYFNKSLSFRARVALHLNNLLARGSKDGLTYLIAGVKSRLNKITGKLEREIEYSSLTADETTSPTASTFIANHLTAITDAIFKAQEQAVRDYLPQAYSGRVVLFRSLERSWWIVSDRQLGWGKFVVGGLEVYEVPGNHESIVRANVGVLAEKLQMCL